MIISVGYRVKSGFATRFRKWATSVLKDYAIKEYAINNKIDYNTQLKLIKILERTTDKLESKEILSILEQYALVIQRLDDFNHQKAKKPKGVSQCIE
jgi:hypothetical protein